MLDILLVDDEPSILLPLAQVLRDEGHRVVTCSDGASAMSALAARVFGLVICDVRMQKVDGFEVFRRARSEAPGTRVIMMTAWATVPDAVTALKEGAIDYLPKPFDIPALLKRVADIDKEAELVRNYTQAEANKSDQQSLVGGSPAVARMLERVKKFADNNAPVLISGESGTGKELIAHLLHEHSPRRNGPFVAINCAAFPETLLEAELFGHERGAFTGAVRRRDGRFKAAHGGTLFLDEVPEMPLASQAKLLRVLQLGTFEPLGTNQTVTADVRIISATHRNVKELVAQRLFREDLYYRLNALELQVPPLRDRGGDVLRLVSHFLNRFANGARPPTLSARAMAALTEYPFPGNVRELEHAMQHAVVLAGGGQIDLHHLPAEIAGRQASQNEPDSQPRVRPLPEAVKEFEREYLKRALQQTQGRRGEAANMLGISRKNLWEKLRGYGFSDAELTLSNHSSSNTTGTAQPPKVGRS